LATSENGLRTEMLTFARTLDAIRNRSLWSDLSNPGSFLATSGWLRSRQAGRSIDAAGNPLPWYTYASIEFLRARLDSSMRVFEYGCGNSTLWYAARVDRVVACEHDDRWAKEIRELAPSPVRIVRHDVGNGYAEAISKEDHPFDIIAIDGEDRNRCASAATERLSPAGVIVWDDSEREDYLPGLKFIKDIGFRQIDFDGPGPITLYSRRTSILYRQKNCLQI
jgi:hypothetical protein